MRTASGNGKQQNSNEVSEPEHVDTGVNLDNGKLQAEEKVSKAVATDGKKDMNNNSETDQEHLISDICGPVNEDVLELTDEDMSLSTPVKRAREEETSEQETNAKKVREELSTDVADLSERTLTDLVGRAIKMAQKHSVLSEEATKAIVDNTIVLGKLTSAITSLKNTIEDHDREERRREERRREMDVRREDEWRRALWRLRDEERRWEERRRELERKDREERRKEDQEQKDRDENRKEEQKENSRGKENIDVPPRSGLGRQFTKDRMIDHAKYRRQ